MSSQSVLKATIARADARHMGLLDRDKSSLPSLSWDSIVDDAPSNTTDEPRSAAEPTPAVAPPAAPRNEFAEAARALLDEHAARRAGAAPSAADPATSVRLGVPVAQPGAAAAPNDATPDAGMGDALARDLVARSVGSQETPPTPVAPSAPAAAPPGVAPAPQPAAPPSQPPTQTAAQTAAQPAPVAPAPPAHASPAPVAPAPPAHASPPGAAAPAQHPQPSPVAPGPEAPAQPAHAPAPVPQPAPVAAAPSVPTLSLPASPPAPVAAAKAPHPLGSTAPVTSKRRRRNNRRGSGGFGLFLTLLVLAGLVAAAFVYGKPYLFPDDWDAATKPYADAVEAVRGEDIVEPFAVIAEPTTTYARQFDADLLGSWDADLPMWRAFGLADGTTNTGTVSGLITERPDAYFSLTDRQVHIATPSNPATIGAATMVAAAEAVLDQEHRWTLLIGSSTAERDALVRALVMTEAQRIQASSSFVGAAPTLGAHEPRLPALLDHRLMAPSVYAEVIGAPVLADESRMAELESYALLLPGATALPLAAPPALDPGETTAGPSVAMDRSFWYLAFASRLEAPIAHDLSNTITAASLTPIRTGELATCWVAVFDTVGPEASAALSGALATWVENSPTASNAGVIGVSESAVQLRTCDPGPAAATTNPAVARRLLGHRAAELAVIAAITERGGGDVEVAAGLELLAQSTIGDELAALPTNVSGQAIGAEATTRVTPIIATVTASLPVADTAPVDVAPTITTVPTDS